MDEPIDNHMDENADNLPLKRDKTNSDYNASNTQNMPLNPNIRKEIPINQFVSSNEWFSKIGWQRNPFTFNITPDLFVGYRQQKNDLVRLINERHKMLLVVGPTGSGKTTFLRWVSDNLSGEFFDIYIGKPPENVQEFVDIFSYELRPTGFFARFFGSFRPNIRNIHELPEYAKKRLGKRHLVLLIDEIHEANGRILEWIRAMGDHVDNMTIILSGLPVFDKHLNDLETLRKRIVAKIEVLSLTKEDTLELIRKRIENVGGKGTEFDLVFEKIYEKTEGFPREVIRLCNDIVDIAIRKGAYTITPDLLFYEVKKESPIMDILENLTPMQREIVHLLTKPMTPGQLADIMDISKYKSRQHAVRSVNNVMQVLLKDGFVERVKEDKAFLYHLAPKIKTLVVKA